MNYPHIDHVLFTDSTPILGFMVKLFGLESNALAIYNLFFIVPLLFASAIAYKIGQQLDFNIGLNIVFALCVVWLHPMMFCMGEWVNLSMSIYFLIGIYLYMKWAKNPEIAYGTVAVMMLLVVAASLTHLPLILFLIGPAIAMAALRGSFKKSIIALVALLASALCVIVFAKVSDPISAMRPTDLLGYNVPSLTCAWSDYFKSYECLKLPVFYEQKDWNIEKLTFLGSAYPLIILIAIYMSWTVRRKYKLLLKGPKENYIIGIATGTIVCYFTSLGSYLEIFNDSVKIYNIFNPLNIIAELSESAKNFRSMARFSLPAFTGLLICGFYILNVFLRSSKYKIAKVVIVSIICILYLIDFIQMTGHTMKSANQANLFSTVSNSHLPQFSTNYDALMPLPYYHVGTEKKGFIIDDNNFWSRETYRRALHYQLPLMACKMSRTPLVTAERMFSLFSDNPDAELLGMLKGKKILIIEDTVYKRVEIDTEPAATISMNHEKFLEVWKPDFLLEKDGVKYYELEF